MDLWGERDANTPRVFSDPTAVLVRKRATLWLKPPMLGPIPWQGRGSARDGALRTVSGRAPNPMKPPRSKLRGIIRKGIVCETPRFLTLFPLQGNLGASSEESPD